jgi:hypothetical protein
MKMKIEDKDFIKGPLTEIGKKKAEEFIHNIIKHISLWSTSQWDPKSEEEHFSNIANVITNLQGNFIVLYVKKDKQKLFIHQLLKHLEQYLKLYDEVIDEN